jgi:hypothetical protein
MTRTENICVGEIKIIRAENISVTRTEGVSVPGHLLRRRWRFIEINTTWTLGFKQGGELAFTMGMWQAVFSLLRKWNSVCKPSLEAFRIFRSGVFNLDQCWVLCSNVCHRHCRENAQTESCSRCLGLGHQQVGVITCIEGISVRVMTRTEAVKVKIDWVLPELVPVTRTESMSARAITVLPRRE